MGFLSQFRKQQQEPRDDSMAQMLDIARQIAGNNPQAAVQRMANSGVSCTLPNGRMVLVSDLVNLANGCTPQQFLDKLGLQ